MDHKKFYNSFVGKDVAVRIGNDIIHGNLVSLDGYLNSALFVDQETIYIRGTNVDYISLSKNF